MVRAPDPRYGNILIDANALDRTGGSEDQAMDALLKLADDGEIILLLPYSVKDEIAHPHTPPEVKRRAGLLIYSEPVTLTAPETTLSAKVYDLVRGNAQSDKHERDAFHLFEASKNGGRYFVTNDDRLLRKAPEIWKLLQLRIAVASGVLAAYHAYPPSAE